MKESVFRSAPFGKGLFVALAANGAGLLFACSVLAFGFFGVGMSSQPPDELRQTWNSFAALAFCCPGVLNLGVLGYVVFDALQTKDNRIWAGWALGLGIAALPLCLLGVFSALIGSGG